LEELAVLVPEHAPTASLAQQAYYRLRDRIVTLRLAPGSLVNERELVEQLGVGRTPVREALHRLADDGLVEVYPRRGIYVGAVDVGDLRAISELRTELEGFAARLAAERRTPDDQTAIAGLLAELARPTEALPEPPGLLDGRSLDGRSLEGRSLEGRSLDGAPSSAPSGSDGNGVPVHAAPVDAQQEHRLIHLDQRIHRLVHQAAHNPVLESALDRAYVLALRLWFLALGRMDPLHDAVQEHHELLAAIEAGDGARAETIAREHVAGFEQHIRQLL
jgi:DNA-binding GntR family transcriptional regulator